MMLLFQVSSRAREPGPTRGFTLLELMIVLLVMSILLGLAIPSYQRYVQRGQRAEAERMLLAVAACQERLRSLSGYYDTSRCLDDSGNAQYSLRIEPAAKTTAMEFTVLAEPRSARAEDDCGTLSLDQSGTRGIAGVASALAKCWGGR